jgi:hypothetical protein
MIAQTSTLLVVATASAVSMPAFSWSTTPVFQQLCSVNGTYDNEFSTSKLAWLAQHFPLITLEHCQGQGAETYAGNVLEHGFIEDHFLAAAAQIKQTNSSTTVLYYNNQDSALQYYRLFRPLYEDHPEWAIKGCSGGGGHMFPNLTDKCSNLALPEVQALWLTHFANMTKEGSPLDGMFVDVGGNKNKNTTSFFGSLQAANKDKIIGHVGGLEEEVPYRLKQTYTFESTDANIQKLEKCSSGGDTICEAHMQFAFDSKEPPSSAVNLIPLKFNASLAAFLIGAGEYSYFAFSTKTVALGPGFCGGPAPTWCYGMGWSEDFLRPLGGAPDGPANRSALRRYGGNTGHEYTRTFGGGQTKVVLDTSTQTCRIDWADGHSTVCTNAPAPPAPSMNCTFEQETGYDDLNIRSLYVVDSGKGGPHWAREACCMACRNEPTCVVAVIDKHNKTGAGSIACYLKASDNEILTGHEGLVSCHPTRAAK